MDIQIQAYEKHKNLKIAANELGMKWQTLYVHLKKNNIPVTGDKLRYGSDTDRLAARAELLFQKLVPYAEDQNALKFQSKIDFVVGVDGVKVDIKAATLKQGCKAYTAKRWSFSVKKQELIADYIVCFAFYDLDGHKTFLLPSELIRNYQTISISENGKSKWNQYEITDDDLLIFFNEISPESI
jgi:hypothetical protein